MKTSVRLGFVAVALATLGLSGCFVDPGYWGRDGHGRDRDSGSRGEGRNERDCRTRGDDGRCRDYGRYER